MLVGAVLLDPAQVCAVILILVDLVVNGDPQVQVPEQGLVI